MSGLLWVLIVLLVLAWALGYFAIHLGNVIFLLLVIALVILIYQITTGRRTL